MIKEVLQRCGVEEIFKLDGELGIDFEEKAFYDILKELCVKYDFKLKETKFIWKF